MLRTIKASIDERGTVTLSEPVTLKSRSRALVTILDESPQLNEAAILAEAALAPEWLNSAEDEAWKHLADLPDLDEAKE